jgi:hypothetical protein
MYFRCKGSYQVNLEKTKQSVKLVHSNWHYAGESPRAPTASSRSHHLEACERFRAEQHDRQSSERCFSQQLLPLQPHLRSEVSVAGSPLLLDVYRSQVLLQSCFVCAGESLTNSPLRARAADLGVRSCREPTKADRARRES